MARVETVAIANADGSDYIIINAGDFDPSQHTKWNPRQKKPPGPAPVPVSEPNTSGDDISQRSDELYDNHTVAELEDMAKALEMSGYSSLNKRELCDAIATAESAG